MDAQYVVVGLIFGTAVFGLGRMLIARAGIGRSKPDCGCGSCASRRGKEAK